MQLNSFATWMLVVLALINILVISRILHHTKWATERRQVGRLLSMQRIAYERAGFFSRDGYDYSVYGLEPPRFAIRNLRFFAWYVSRSLKRVMSEQQLNLSVAEFALTVLTVRGKLYDSPTRSSLYRVDLSLSEIAVLLKNNFNAGVVFQLLQRGLSFEEILEYKGVPVVWVEHIYT